MEHVHNVQQQVLKSVLQLQLLQNVKKDFFQLLMLELLHVLLAKILILYLVPLLLKQLNVNLVFTWQELLQHLNVQHVQLVLLNVTQLVQQNVMMDFIKQQLLVLLAKEE